MPSRLDSAAAAASWLAARVTGTLRSDSRAVRPGDGFIAWPGAATDGRRFVPAALAAGAAACLVEDAGAEAFGLHDPRIASLAGLKAAAGALADALFGSPSQALSVVAVTGTNGKTSTAWWTAQALTALGRRCGIVGTLGIGEPPHIAPAGGAPQEVLATGLTTPDPVTLHAALRGFVDRGFAACALEASSIGLDESRLAATRIEVASFTNFTRDHLDYHGSMDAYRAAKQRLFAWPGLRAAVDNVDDETGAMLAAGLRGGGLDLWTVSRLGPARLQARDLGYRDGGLAFDVV
ncbi:MAG TPA: Mur ligase family protein, partial [Rubrivivax sp.]|nr:Mur ligase family protein [Rubrivivax sp.]